LQAGGATVRLLEAQGRVGGRASSVKLTDGLVYEHGAQFFNRDMTRLNALIDDHGLARRSLWQDPGTLGLVQGQRQTGPSGFLTPAILAAIAATPPDAAESLADWAASQRLEGAALIAFRAGVEGIWSRPPKDLSFRTLRAQIAQQGDLTQTPFQFSCVEGMGTLAARMGHALGPSLTLHAPITRVDRGGGLFHLSTGAGTVVARHLVIASSPVVLGRIAFRAPQDRWLTTFPRRFAPGQMRKIVLRYASAFWRGSNTGWLWQTDTPPGLSVIDSSDAAGGFDTLTVMAGGTAATVWQDQAPLTVLLELMDVLEPLLGPEVRKPVTVLQADWTDHPFVGGGCNSWPRPWTVDDPIAPLQTGHDRLHFAGADSAPQFQGFVEGALRSGEAVAQRILQDS
jgi:monoamine oxidase